MTWRRLAGPFALLACCATVAACGTTDDSSSGDKATGGEAGAVYLPAPQTGSPMTYMLKGTQYLVVAIGGAGYPGELISFKVSP